MNEKSSMWSDRAGVIVSYQPEDTMKSFIFEEHNRHCLPINNYDGKVRNLPKSETERVLDLLSSDDESDSSLITKKIIKNGWSKKADYGEPHAEGKMTCNSLLSTQVHELGNTATSSCDKEEHDSTWADLSSDLGDVEFNIDSVISASNKSFEEILENKLHQEKFIKNENVSVKVDNTLKPKFSFLRKNAGKAAWCSKPKKDLKNVNMKSLSSGRELVKLCSEKIAPNTNHRRMKSMPAHSNVAEIKSITLDVRPKKNNKKTVHFAERSDHEMSTETLDTVKSLKIDKINNQKKEIARNITCDTNVNEEIDKDLIEFELLEEIANVSMSSTSSSIAKLDEDMLRERVLKIQKMPPPKIQFQNQYFDNKKLVQVNVKSTNDQSKLPKLKEVMEHMEVNNANISDNDEDSESTCSNSTILSKFTENILCNSEMVSVPQKQNTIRKISKQNDRQKLILTSDNEESWIEASPFELTAHKSDVIQQTQNNSIHSLPPVNWTFADPFQQSDLSSEDEISCTNKKNEPPPCSTEVKNIFPDFTIDKKQANPDDNVSIQSAKLKRWVTLLETEIKRFNKENEEIAKIKSEQENGLKRLENEMNEFSKHKDEETKQFEEYKQNETKKLKKERKVFEEYQEAMKNMPNKKDREEIEKLKSEIQSMKEEAVTKESRWQSVNTRLKQKIEQLETDNSEMHSRIHGLEQKRLQLQAQLISYSSQAPSKSSDQNNNKCKSTVTAVAQALSLKHTNNPINSNIKSDNKFLTSPRISVQNHKAVSKSINSSTKNIKSNSKPEPSHNKSDKVDVRGSAASDYYTGEEETGSIDSHLNYTTEVTTLRENNHSLPIPNILHSVPYAMKINRSNDPLKEEIRHQDGILEKIYRSGAIDVNYPNGSLKQISADGKSIVIHLFNGDIKQITPDGCVTYFYSQDESTQTTFSDGKEEILYKNGQKEVIHPSGIREIHFPDKSIKILHPDSREENILPNGLRIRMNGAGDKEILLPNGQREIHSKGIKKRIYPDGTTKTVYSDGRQETYYASGRMRVKDINGVLILDQYIDKVIHNGQANTL